VLYNALGIAEQPSRPIGHQGEQFVLNISKETALQTEARLRRVIRQATLHVYEGAYAFNEFPLAQFTDHVNPSTLALVRDDLVWSQLMPAGRGDREKFAVWRFHFPSGIDNSGFVGWLASHLKAKFGTGVFVTCGCNSGDGGIFDYWGAPLELAGPVIQEIRTLTGAPNPPDATQTNMTGVIMEVIETSDTSVIGPETIFRFEQDGEVVRAQYEGGRILAGSLVGYWSGATLEFCFSQLESPSSLQTGSSVCTVRHQNGALELVENFRWDNPDRSSGRNILREIL
jgi:hypothetical protein